MDIKDVKSKSAGKKIAQELSPKIPVALVEHSISPPEYFVQFGQEIKEVRIFFLDFQLRWVFFCI